MFRIIRVSSWVPKENLALLLLGQRLSYFFKDSPKKNFIPRKKAGSKQEETKADQEASNFFTPQTTSQLDGPSRFGYSKQTKLSDPFLKPKNPQSKVKEISQKNIEIGLEEKEVDRLVEELVELKQQKLAQSIKKQKKTAKKKTPFLLSLMSASLLVPEMTEKHPEVIKCIATQLFLMGQIEQIVLNHSEDLHVGPFVQTFEPQICRAIECAKFDFSLFTTSLMRFSRDGFERAEFLGGVRKSMGDLIVRRMMYCDLSTAQNMEAVQLFFEVLDSSFKFIGFEFQFLRMLVEQIPFFSLEAQTRCLIIFFTSRKSNFCLKKQSLRGILDFLLTQEDFVVEQIPQYILYVANSLARLNDKLSREFEQRDQALTVILLTILNKSKTNHLFGLKLLSKYIRAVGGKLLVEEYDRQLHEGITSFIFLQIKALEGKQPELVMTDLSNLQELLTALLEHEIILQEQFKKDLELVKKKLQQLAEGQPFLKSSSIFNFLERDLPSVSDANGFNQIRKLRPSQVYLKLKQAVEESNTELVEVVLSLLLDPKGGHYYYNFIKTNQLLEAESIFDQAIRHIVVKKQLSIFKDIFNQIIKKSDRRYWLAGDIIFSLNKENDVQAKELWNYYYLAWSEIFEREQIDKVKMVGSFIDTLISLTSKTDDDGDLLTNPHFYSALDLISPETLADSEHLLNYFHLLDYLLTEEKSKKGMSPLLYSIVIDADLSPYGELLRDNLPAISLKLAQFKLRYVQSPEAIQAICQQDFSGIVDEDQDSFEVKLTQVEERLLAVLKKQDLTESPNLPISKENLPILLLQLQNYSEEERARIWEQLDSCCAHELAQILSSPVAESICRKGQRKVWQLLLQKLQELDTIVWIPLLATYHKIAAFRGYVERLVRVIMEEQSKRQVIMSIGGFRQITLSLQSTNLLLEKGAVEPFFQSQVRCFLNHWSFSPSSLMLKRFKVYLLAGYCIPLQEINKFLPNLARFSKSYHILFHHESGMAAYEFQSLMGKFLEKRLEHLQEEDKVENSQISEFLGMQFPEVSRLLIEYCRGNKGKPEQSLEEKQFDRIYTLLEQHYRGISLVRKSFLHINNTIILLTDEYYSETKVTFFKRLLASFSETKNKPLKVIPVTHNLFKSSVLKTLEIELNLKPKIKSTITTPHLQSSSSELQKKLASEVAELQRKKGSGHDKKSSQF